MTESAPTALSVSVVIPVLNGSEGLRRTIERLQHCDLPADVSLEIIVSDDGSTDGSPDLASSLGAVVVLGDHAGPSAARNRGAQAATGDILMFLDSGDEPRPAWLRELVIPFSDPLVGASTCSADIHDLEAGTTATYTLTRFGRPRIVALSGCFALRKSLFDEVGGYDRVLRFGENSDICERVEAATKEIGLEVHYSFEVLIEVEFGKPAAHYDRFRLDSIEYLLERDRDELRSQAAKRAHMHGIAAVNAGRCGEWRRARSHAWASIRSEPRRGRNYVRAALTLLPPLARWRWTSPVFRRRMTLDQ